MRDERVLHRDRCKYRPTEKQRGDRDAASDKARIVSMKSRPNKGHTGERAKQREQHTGVTDEAVHQLNRPAG
jgi:hypothetical protein